MSKENPENLKLTPTSEIKKLREEREQGKLVKLPSGIVVSLKKPNLSQLIVTGDIPSDLMSLALGKEALDDLSPEGIKKGLKLIDLLVKHSIVSPKVVDKDAGDDEILIADLSEEDKSFIVGDAQKEVGNLKSFRSQQGEGSGSGHNKQEVSEPKAE